MIILEFFGFLRRRSWIRRLFHDQQGATVVFLAFALVPLLVAIGMATDIARAYFIKSKLSTALDSAALAGGRSFFLEDRNDQIRDYFWANLPNGFMGAHISDVDIQEMVSANEPEQLRVSATADVPTVFMQMFGFETMSVASVAEVTRENRSLQLVMVLDNTGSMSNNNKIAQLKTASRELVDILFGNQKDEPHDRLKIAVVPYAVAVNVGDLGDAFIDYSDVPAHYRYDPTDEFMWKGCVEARQVTQAPNPSPFALEPDAYDINVAPVTIGGRWKPYRYPQDYDNQWGDFPNGEVPSLPSTDQTNVDPRDYGFGPNWEEWPAPEGYLVVNTATGPNLACPAPLMTFENDFDTVDGYLETNIRSWPRGGTLGSEGLSWAWRLLDPGAPFPNPVDYNDPLTAKAVVMMTDGVNGIHQHVYGHYQDKDGDGNRSLPANNASDRPVSDYSAYGRVDDGRLGTTTSRAVARNAINVRMSKVCNAMKSGGVAGKDKITIYTIIFGDVATSGSGDAADLRQIYEDCASDPSKAFLAPDGDTLRDNFRAIGNDLANLHLSK